MSTTLPTTIPYRLRRIGVVMTPDRSNPFEVEGVLNPASGRGSDGELYLLPRIVAEGNVSRVGLARVVTDDDGTPTGVERDGVILAPDQGWERSRHNAGTEDPRITFIPSLGLHVMTYVAYGPLSSRTAIAVSEDLRHWRRLGPLTFGFEESLSMDLGLFPNKDTVWFPEPVAAPDGTPSFALLHRPMWDLSPIRAGEGVHLPAGIEDETPSIWISFAPVAEVARDIRNLTRVWQHQELAVPEFSWEHLRIGAGPAPIRVPEGWLLIHHGVSGELSDNPLIVQNKVFYSAGAMILDAADVTRVIARTAEPLLAPETEEEKVGTVGNVVFPTAIETIGDRRFVFYGMADAHIGVAELESVR